MPISCRPCEYPCWLSIANAGTYSICIGNIPIQYMYYTYVKTLRRAIIEYNRRFHLALLVIKHSPIRYLIFQHVSATEILVPVHYSYNTHQINASAPLVYQHRACIANLEGNKNGHEEQVSACTCYLHINLSTVNIYQFSVQF